MYRIMEDGNKKCLMSKDYNYMFNKKNGAFLRWGKTYDDDPEVAPGPEILDFEITTICDEGCPFCYKSNTKKGHNTSFAEFKNVFDYLPRTVTQIAFGVDASATANPDLFKMMWYARERGVIPNITVANINDKTAEKLANVCGAVAVSRHKDSTKCYNSIKLLRNHGLDQINIHVLISEETYDLVKETMLDYIERKIPGLNAIVLLSLKQKGRGEGFSRMSAEKYQSLINFALNNNIPIGADSCSASRLIRAVKGRDNFKEIKQMVDPCESTRMSLYIDVDCKAHPCSFCPGTEKWMEGIDMTNIKDFNKQVWNNYRISKFRNNLIDNKDENGCHQCLIYDI